MRKLPLRDGDLLNDEQLAQVLGCSSYHIRKLRQKKKIPFIKLGWRTIRYDLTRVRKALEKYEVSEVA